MTENKDKIVDKDKDKKTEIEAEKANEKDKDKDQQQIQQKEQPTKTEQHQQHSQHDRGKRLSQFWDMLNLPRHHHHHHSGHSGSSSSNTSQPHSPQTPQAIANAEDEQQHHQHHQQQEHQHQQRGSLYRTTCVSFQSEIFLLDTINGEIIEFIERSSHKDDYGTQRVYKKTSPNCVLTLYLPTREITLSGSTPSILRGIVFVDPKAIQGYRVYAQLTLTFRYGREDEEVMGLRFCNEAIMSIHQIWPRNEEPNKDTLSPLQDALLKRLGDGAHPFTLSLTSQAPPSVQLVPAKRYYGAPIGTSYDVRCFIADKTDERFHRRASVKMGVRVIYRTDVFSHGLNGPENFAALINNPVTSPPVTLHCTNTLTTAAPSICSQTSTSTDFTTAASHQKHPEVCSTTSAPLMATTSSSHANDTRSSGKARKSERGDSFPKLRLSPKSFRFSSRFSRSKSEVEKCPNDAFYNYSKSFQEYDSVCAAVGGSGVGGGPQGSVDKPFLLQDGRVGLRASLDKAWYTHGEDVCVTINIRNDSRKTVRKVRVCAIQHVDVCMFNNGKFKNVVADSENISPPTIDRHVAPGATLNTTVTLKPQRGPTKNWIALEDTLQRSTEPDEITGLIAASAVRTPHFLMQAGHSPNSCTSPAVFVPPLTTATASGAAATNPTSNNDERNVFAIYVSYYVKVKLTLSSMGGELSLKLPFVLVHIDEEQRQLHEAQKLNLDEVPANKKNGNKSKLPGQSLQEFSKTHNLDRIESEDDNNLQGKVNQVHSQVSGEVNVATLKEEDLQPSTSSATNRRRPLIRSETIAKDIEDDLETDLIDKIADAQLEQVIHIAQIHSNNHLSNDNIPLNISKTIEKREIFSRQNTIQEDIIATVPETEDCKISNDNSSPVLTSSNEV